MYRVGDLVKVKNPDTEERGELLSTETINLLKELDFTGTVTQVQDGLIYVGFAHEKLGWVTQVYKDDEIEVITDE